MSGLLLLHINWKVIFFGLLAVAAFWYAIQLCSSAVGKPWHGAVLRLVGAVALFGVGVVMIFFTAFGAN